MPTATTDDALLGGRVFYRQPAKGYRVALEAPLLAWFAICGRTRPFAHVVDLGAGPGAIGLMLALTGWAERVTAVELDPFHARLARENGAQNGLTDRFQVLEGPVEDARLAAAELVIANPPYFDPLAGEVAADARRAQARALTPATLSAFVQAGQRALGRKGRLVVGFPAGRLMGLLEALERAGLRAKRARFVHPRAGREAQVVFLEAKPGRPGGLLVEAPLIVRGTGEAYTAEVDAALRGRWGRGTR